MLLLFSNPEETRPYFKHMKKPQSFLISNLPEFSLCELSLCISSDNKVVIEE